MITYALSKERRVRVWINESPANLMPDFDHVSHCRRISSQNIRPLIRKCVVIEVFIPLGGRFLYGLLGGEAIDCLYQDFNLVAFEMVATDSVFNGSLAGDLDIVSWGLPNEYIDSVLDGACIGIEKYGLPDAATIQFHLAAFGEIGSTVSIFRRLAIIIIAFMGGLNDREFDIRVEIERILDVMNCGD